MVMLGNARDSSHVDVFIQRYFIQVHIDDLFYGHLVNTLHLQIDDGLLIGDFRALCFFLTTSVLPFHTFNFQ